MLGVSRVSTTKNTVLGIKKFSNILFTLAIFFTSCCFIDNYSDRFFFFDYEYRWLKFLLSLVLPTVVTVIHYIINRNLLFIADRTASVMVIFSVLYALDCFVFKLNFRIQEALGIYHLAYGLITFFSIFALITLFALIEQKNNRFNNTYAQSIKAFFIGSVPMFVIGFISTYFLSRKYDDLYEPLNLIPFKGEMSVFINTHNPECLIRDAGNVLFFTAMSIVLLGIIKRCKFFWGFCAPVIISVSMEIYQYFFKCGDPDIDDVILNTVGAILGCVIYKFIIEKIKENELCWESSEQWMWR